MSKTVKIVLSFPVPELEPGCDSPHHLELIEYWESRLKSPERIGKDVIALLEDEHIGIANYGTVIIHNHNIS